MQAALWLLNESRIQNIRDRYVRHYFPLSIHHNYFIIVNGEKMETPVEKHSRRLITNEWNIIVPSILTVNPSSCFRRVHLNEGVTVTVVVKGELKHMEVGRHGGVKAQTCSAHLAGLAGVWQCAPLLRGGIEHDIMETILCWVAVPAAEEKAVAAVQEWDGFVLRQEVESGECQRESNLGVGDIGKVESKQGWALGIDAAVQEAGQGLGELAAVVVVGN